MENRDAARARFAGFGLSSSEISKAEFRDLLACLTDAFKNAPGLAMRIDGRRSRMSKNSHGCVISIRCRSAYFDDREAITFNPGGFVGFAGWADDSNIKPILAGFAQWCDRLEIARRAEARQTEPSTFEPGM